MQTFPYLVAAVLTFEALIARPLPLRPERHAQHPRLFFDADGLEKMRAAAADDPAAWRAFLDSSHAVRHAPPPASSSQERGLMYKVGLAMPEPAFAYAVTRDDQHLAQARAWIKAVLSYEPWGYAYSKPDQDIPAAHLLYGLATSFDLLYNDLAPTERDEIRDTLIRKARKLYEAYTPRPKRRYSYSQNHTFINAAAVGFVALALDVETKEMKEWLSFARAVFERTIETYSRDGYYYEGYHYFEFSVPWIVHMLDALEHNTADRPYDRIALGLSKHYVAHSLLPRGHFFDFGDAGRGAADRLAGTSDLLGAHEMLYRLAERYADPQSRAVADWASARVTRSREPMWRFIWRVPRVPQVPLVPLVHHFKDADVVFARTSWDDDATAVAFKCGPPEGHRAAALLPKLPDWRQSTGHAHPDVGSFILFSHGTYVTGDSGYTGVKMTSDHNTLLIDGRGQANDGRHEVFPEVPRDRLDAIRLIDVKTEGAGFHAVCDGTTAYDPALGLTTWRRTFSFDGRDVEVADLVETKSPRAATVLLHSDRALDETTLKGRPTSVVEFLPATVVSFAPSTLTARIDPHVVVTQGRPGSVENGEKEQRGSVLRLTAPPATRTDIRIRLSPEQP